MAWCEQIAMPVDEPVSLAVVKKRLRLPPAFTDHDDMLTGLIVTTRQDGERLSGLTLAQRQFTQVLDSFPYYTDTIQSQQAYPPSYYSLPRYSTTLWNYSQMIKLARAPLISVDSITYIGTDGLEHVLHSGTDFIVDPETHLARIFPRVGQFWPAVIYAPNAVKIIFTAGFSKTPSDVTVFGLPSPPPAPPNQQTTYRIVTGIPQSIADFLTALVVDRYQYPGKAGMEIEMEQRFMALGTGDMWAPTRG
jgi:hypothetical protein